MQFDPKELRLFHYTSQFQYLFDILKFGIWPRYCVEDFEWLLGYPTYIAFPVACFCDIPLQAAADHRDRYGKYSICFSKHEFSEKSDINPVWYLQESHSLAKQLKSHLSEKPPLLLSQIPIQLRPLLPFLKSIVGFQPDRKNQGEVEFLFFDEELEWRCSPLDLIDTWLIKHTNGVPCEDYHKKSLDHRIQFSLNDVDEVFVTSEAEAGMLHEHFPGLQKISIH